MPWIGRYVNFKYPIINCRVTNAFLHKKEVVEGAGREEEEEGDEEGRTTRIPPLRSDECLIG